MKKYNLYAAAILFMLFFSCGDKKVTPETLQAFAQKYPSIDNEKWSRDSHGNFEAAFKLDGIKYRADFDFDNGSWIETEETVRFSDIPEAVQQAVSKKYSQEQISEIEKVDHHIKGVFYDVEFKAKGKNPDIEFNDAGEVIGFEN